MLISIDVKANQGFLKKPDINEGIYLTFNMLHKPALLGVLGAILGLAGYQRKGELPQYYQKLKNLSLGIQPLNSNQGNYIKTVVQYNNGVGYASYEQGGNLIVCEQIIINPAYRCYLMLDLKDNNHTKLLEHLKNNHAEYLPYLGKNEFSLWWENFQEHLIKPFDHSNHYQVQSIFSTEQKLHYSFSDQDDIMEEDDFEQEFMYFERLPVGFDEQLCQYQYQRFAYTNFTLDKQVHLENSFCLENNNVIQLF